MTWDQQPSIRSFFQPRLPKYAGPPSSSTSSISQARATPPSSRKPPTDPRPTATATTDVGAGLSPGVPVPQQQDHIQSFLLERTSSPVRIHPQVTVAPVQEKHIPALRRINALLLPVSYPDAFYHGVLDPGISGIFSRVILWHDDDEKNNPAAAEPTVIGGIVCRLEPSPFTANGGLGIAANAAIYGRQQQRAAPPAATPSFEQVLYVQSLTLLSPYRSLGLAAATLDCIIASAAASPRLNIHAVYAHVWTENADALTWYKARGFSRLEQPIPGYYFKLRPDSAWIVRRDLPSAAASSTPPSPSMASPTQSGREPSVTAAAANLPPLSNGNSVSLPSPTARVQSVVSAPAVAPPAPSSSVSNSALSTPPPPPQNYQNTRPESEWNDLPEGMIKASSTSSSRTNLLVPEGTSRGSSGPPSGASSRSSSTARKKKDRAYPAAAFGS